MRSGFSKKRPVLCYKNLSNMCLTGWTQNRWIVGQKYVKYVQYTFYVAQIWRIRALWDNNKLKTRYTGHKTGENVHCWIKIYQIHVPRGTKLEITCIVGQKCTKYTSNESKSWKTRALWDTNICLNARPVGHKTGEHVYCGTQIYQTHLPRGTKLENTCIVGHKFINIMHAL